MSDFTGSRSDTSADKIARIPMQLRRKALQTFTLMLVKLTTQKYAGRVFTRSGGTILYCNLCIKFGESVTLSEANTLKFVAGHTSIPVPKVYHAFTHQGRTYILMERIRGETIAQRWPSLSETSKASLFSQLKLMMEQLRSVPCETNGVCGLDGGPIHDYRLPPPSGGPFPTMTDFHLSLTNNVVLRALELSNASIPAVLSDLEQLAIFHESTLRAPVLTHGNLSSLNILVREDKVVGILDWEMAGWLPYYWEYTTAWHAHPQNDFWQNEVGKFLEVQEEELFMEKIRRSYFGDV